MKNLFIALAITMVLLYACKLDYTVPPVDTTCNVPDAGVKYSSIYYEMNGCDNFLTYIPLENEKSILVIKGDTTKLKISTKTKEFDLAIAKENELKIWIDFFAKNGDAIYSSTCNHSPIAFPLETWKCVAGKISVQITRENIRTTFPKMYEVHIKAINCLVFQKPDGTKVKIPTLDFPKIRVGWFIY